MKIWMNHNSSKIIILQGIQRKRSNDLLPHVMQPLLQKQEYATNLVETQFYKYLYTWGIVVGRNP